MAELLFKNEVYAIIGAAMDVYNHLGAGFSEAIYQEAMEIEVESRNIPNNPQQDIFIHYKGQKVFSSISGPTKIWNGSGWSSLNKNPIESRKSLSRRAHRVSTTPNPLTMISEDWCRLADETL